MKASFEEIARETGGRCHYLDINSTGGANLLTEIVAVEVLKNAGNQNGGVGQILVDEYAKKYGIVFK